MRCNKKNIFAAFGSVALLSMPVLANAQALGVRVGSLSIGSATTGGVSGLGSVTSGLGLGSIAGGNSLASVNLAPVSTTGLVTANTGNINASVLGGGSVLSTSVAPISANVAGGLVTANTGSVNANVLGGGSVLNASISPINANVGNGLAVVGTPGVNATVLGGGSLATVSTGGPLNVNVGTPSYPGGVSTPAVIVDIGGGGGGTPVIRLPIGRNLSANPNPSTPVTLGADSFFSGGADAGILRVSGRGGGGGSFYQSADSGSSDGSQSCERVLLRPADYTRIVVSQCRRAIGMAARRRG